MMRVEKPPTICDVIKLSDDVTSSPSTSIVSSAISPGDVDVTSSGLEDSVSKQLTLESNNNDNSADCSAADEVRSILKRYVVNVNWSLRFRRVKDLGLQQQQLTKVFSVKSVQANRLFLCQNINTIGWLVFTFETSVQITFPYQIAEIGQAEKSVEYIYWPQWPRSVSWPTIK